MVPRLSECLGKTVTLAPDCIGMGVEKMVADMKEGDVILLENVRFYPEEEANEEGDSQVSLPDHKLTFFSFHQTPRQECRSLRQ